MNKHADYVYENNRGTRINIHKRDLGTSQTQWNVYWHNGGEIHSYADLGDFFRTKRAARQWVETMFGHVKSINPKGSWLAHNASN